MPIVPVIPPRGLLSRSNNDGLGGISVRPANARFATQDPDEVIFVLVRKAAITNVGWVFRISFFAVVVPLVISILSTLGVDFIEIVGLVNQILLWVVFYSLLFTYGLMKFNEWYYNLLIITNKRILDYDFKPLTGKKVSEAPLENIEDVTQKALGFFPAFFNYGDLYIQTAAQKSRFEINSVPQPTWLRDVLVDLSRLAEVSEP